MLAPRGLQGRPHLRKKRIPLNGGGAGRRGWLRGQRQTGATVTDFAAWAAAYRELRPEHAAGPTRQVYVGATSAVGTRHVSRTIEGASELQ